MNMYGGNVDPNAQLRNVKDFLLIYNSLTEHCFMKCITNLNYRSMTAIERSCIMNCADIFTKGNQRFMQQFMEHTPEMVRRRNEEAEKQAQKIGMILEEASNPIPDQMTDKPIYSTAQAVEPNIAPNSV